LDHRAFDRTGLTALLVTLLVFGSVSNYLGRRRMIQRRPRTALDGSARSLGRVQPGSTRRRLHALLDFLAGKLIRRKSQQVWPSEAALQRRARRNEEE
jgi:hypothetical protein